MMSENDLSNYKCRAEVKRSLVYILMSVVVAIVMASPGKLSAKEGGMKRQELVPAGPLMNDHIHFQYAIYYLPTPSGDPKKILSQLLSEEPAGPTLVAEIPETPGTPVVSVTTTEKVQEEYTPPDLEFIKYFGRGLTTQQAEQLQESRYVIIMDFAHGKEHVWQALKNANRIVAELATRSGGLLWDEENREVFTPEEWKKRRVESWAVSIPDISDFITIHSYKSGEYVRAITLGMAKFGLPDVVVEDFAWSNNRDMGHLINLFCQAMAEGAVIETTGEYDLDIHKIKNSEVREYQIKYLYPNATGTAQLALKKGIWEEGDPNNRLIEIGFGRYPGRDVHARQTKLVDTLFGSQDDVTHVEHTDELLAASQRAREKLPILQKRFNEGLEPGGYILVKAPFKVPDGGNEWMWVEITEWKENNIRGVLNNEPFYIPTLHAGQVVEIKQEDVFDYLERHPDGTEEGNETGAIIEKMEKTESGQ